MIRIGTRDEMHAAAEHARARGACQLPLFEAAAEGRIAFVYVADTEAGIPAGIRAERRPVVLVIGDDPNLAANRALGPEGWKVARRLQYWQPQYALVHGSGGSTSDYRTAVAVAQIVQRFLLIETSSAMAPAWHDVVAPLCRTVVLTPVDGRHPVAETVH